MKKLYIICLFSLLFASTSFAGMYSASADSNNSRIIAAIEIEDVGIMNLIVSVEFLTKPQDSKIYESDEYGKLLQRIQVEWKSAALQKILESRRLRRSDLVMLKNSIHSEIEILIKRLKKEILPGTDVEVIFAISNFYLLEPREA